MHVLAGCNWPGNVRELENCVERFATMARSNVIREMDIPCQTNHCLSSTLWQYESKGVVIPIAPISGKVGSKKMAEDVANPDLENEDTVGVTSSRKQLIEAMEKSGWVQAKAARLMNLTPRQMSYALKKYNIEVKRF